MVDSDIFIAALKTADEMYVFLYTTRTRADALRCIRRFAVDPSLDLTLPEAARLCREIAEPVDSESMP